LCRIYSAGVVPTVARYKSGDRKIKAGRDLFSQGQSCEEIYNLVEGWVFLYMLVEDGRRQILHFAFPGSLLGFHADDGAAITFSAQALTDAVVCVVPRKNLHPLIEEDARVGEQLAWMATRRNSLAYDHLASVGRQHARERVAHLLLELFIRYRAHWPGHRVEEMHMPLTQEHIGDATGLTSVHVNRVLHDLRDEKIVDFRYRQLRILNPDKLADVSAIDPELMKSWIPHG
jgi:CRP-like cAMP-binding protein